MQKNANKIVYAIYKLKFWRLKNCLINKRVFYCHIFSKKCPQRSQLLFKFNFGLFFKFHNQLFEIIFGVKMSPHR
jgi:hypothetical protein